MRKSARTAWRVVLVAVTLVSAVLFIGSTTSGTRYPDARPFDGWMTVVADADDVKHGTKVRLFVRFTDALQREVEYSVSACGPRETRLLLLMGGGAQLTDPHSPFADLEVETVEGSSVESPSAGLVDLAVLQQVPIHLKDMPRCLDREDGWVGTGVSVYGQPLRPFADRSSTWLRVRDTYSFPLVGQFPGVPAAEAGVFNLQHIDDDLIRPISLEVQVSGGALPVTHTVESARPALADGSSLLWTQPGAVHAVAVLRSESSAQLAARVASIAGVVLGVGMGLLMADLHEKYGRAPRSDVAPRSAASAATRPAHRPDGRSMAMVVLAWLLLRTMRRFGAGTGRRSRRSRRVNP